MKDTQGFNITVLGGGSAYTPGLIAGLLRLRDRLPLARLVLADIDEHKLKIVGELVRHMIEAAARGDEGAAKGGEGAGAGAGGPATTGQVTAKTEVVLTTDRLEGFKGADFILSQIRVGGLKHRALDERIPNKYGVLGQETTGPGGFAMALRSIPVMLDVARDIARVAPDAWLINYTNPTGFVCDASIRAGHGRTIGLCDGVYGIKWLGAKLLGLPISRGRDVEAYVAGLNHCTWTTQLWFEGRDLYKEMESLTAGLDLSGAGEAICDGPLNGVECDAVRLWRYYGLLPGSIYYTRYYYTLKQVLKKFSDPKFQHRSQWLTERAAAKRDNIRRQLAGGQASFAAFDEEDASHGDQAIGAIHAIANDTRQVETANVVNHGAVPNLPDDAIVEVTCTLGRYGAMPAAAGPLPRAVQGIVRMVHDHAVLTVDAAMSGDRKLVMQAAMAHPCHRDFHVMEEVIEEMFRVHKEWLPQF